MTAFKKGVLAFGDGGRFIKQSTKRVELADLPEFECPPGESDQTGIVPSDFRGHWLRVEPITHGLFIVSIQINHNEELAVPSFPAEWCRPNYYDNRLYLSTADTGQIVRLQFLNATPNPIRIRCWLEGHYVDE